jgi:hypothetical protein
MEKANERRGSGVRQSSFDILPIDVGLNLEMGYGLKLKSVSLLIRIEIA